MEFEAGRQLVMDYCRKLAGSSLASGTSGNISARDPDSDRVPIVPYHLYGTEALAGAAGQGLEQCAACLLQNHGVLATEPDFHQAWALAEQIEFCAEIFLRAKAVGEPGILSQAQIAEGVKQLHAYRRQE